MPSRRRIEGGETRWAALEQNRQAAERLKSVRQSRGWNQAELATNLASLLRTPVSQSSVSAWENGLQAVPGAVVMALQAMGAADLSGLPSPQYIAELADATGSKVVLETAVSESGQKQLNLRFEPVPFMTKAVLKQSEERRRLEMLWTAYERPAITSLLAAVLPPDMDPSQWLEDRGLANAPPHAVLNSLAAYIKDHPAGGS